MPAVNEGDMIQRENVNACGSSVPSRASATWRSARRQSSRRRSFIVQLSSAACTRHRTATRRWGSDVGGGDHDFFGTTSPSSSEVSITRTCMVLAKRFLHPGPSSCVRIADVAGSASAGLSLSAILISVLPSRGRSMARLCIVSGNHSSPPVDQSLPPRPVIQSELFSLRGDGRLLGSSADGLRSSPLRSLPPMGRAATTVSMAPRDVPRLSIAACRLALSEADTFGAPAKAVFAASTAVLAAVTSAAGESLFRPATAVVAATTAAVTLCVSESVSWTLLRSSCNFAITLSGRFVAV